MTAARKDIVIEQAANFRLVVSVIGGPEDLSGYTAKMQVRQIKASEELLAEMVGIVNPVTRQVVVEALASVTEDYDWSEGVYDVLMEGAAGSWRIAEGRAILSKSVTR